MAETSFTRSDVWDPCSGEIEQFVKRLKRRRALAVLGKMAGGAAVGAFLAVIFTGSPNLHRARRPVRDFHYGGVTCAEVRANAQEFMSGKLDKAMEQRLQTHFKKCPHCADFVRQMMQKPTARNDSPNLQDTPRDSLIVGIAGF